MRLLMNLTGEPQPLELRRRSPGATVADLVLAAVGEQLDPADEVFVGSQRHTADTKLDDILLLEGTAVDRAPQAHPNRVTGWSATLIGGMHAGLVVALPANRPLVIGRSPQADLCIDSPSTSWEHAQLTLEDEGVRIRDCGSTNGTLVDGRRLKPSDQHDPSDQPERSAGAATDGTGPDAGGPADGAPEVPTPPGSSADVSAHPRRAAEPDGSADPEPADRPDSAGSVAADASRSASSARTDSGSDSKLQREGRLRHRLRRRGGDAGDEPEPDGVLVTDQAVVTVGGASILLRKDLEESPAPAPGSLRNETPTGTVPFNRPPRPGRPEDPDPLVPPSRKDVPDSTKFSIAMVVAPLILAFAMVMVLGDPRFAILAALSPVIGVGTWIEGKHRRKKGLKQEEERFSAAVEEFRGELLEAADDQRRRTYAETPDPATMLRRAAIPTTTLWERRPGAEDFLKLHAGVGDNPWVASVENRSGGRLDKRVRAAMKESKIPAAAVDIDLANAGVVGIVGDRPGSLAVARSLLVQAAVQSGPADLTIGVFCDQGRAEDWGWSSWLPQIRRLGGSTGDRWLSDQRSTSETLLRNLRDSIEQHPTPSVLLLLDSEVLTEGRNAPARSLLGYGRMTGSGYQERPSTQVSGIVLAASEDQLPAACTVIVRVSEDAGGSVNHPQDLTEVDDVVLAGIDVQTAEKAARDLARFDDPELIVPGAALPTLVSLPPLLELPDLSADSIRRAWGESSGVFTPIGVGEEGTFGLDLVRDGPHGLVGGTTGSGKSEFLRSLVAGLAARNSPTKLTFILIDFKGGAAFATCERLPHTIGTISNLDEQLANRALRALEAEMLYRQRMFAAAGEGVDNLDEYLATDPDEPMPRLLLVIDEFAMLAKDYPDVLTSLVSVAAVGRTLGVHMILATQRPAGVVNDDILANTNLRVALRVQSSEDSSNVIGVKDAAGISRQQQGRAYVKLGQDDITPVQTALITGHSEEQDTDAVEVVPVVFGRADAPVSKPKARSDETDLDLLIEAVIEANDDEGLSTPRPVWPEPLGDRVQLAGFDGAELAGDALLGALPAREPHQPSIPIIGGVDGTKVIFALADDPDHQRQVPASWDFARGNLLLLGIPGSGTSTALASLTLTLASAISPRELDVLVLDMGPGDLRPLAELPHTSGYVGSGSGAGEQQVRFLRLLRTELDRRKAEGPGDRRMLIIIDGLAALKEEYQQDSEGLDLLACLYRAYADGTDLGMSFATSTTRAKSIPPAIDEVTTQKWLFQLADPYDYSTAGIKRQEAPPPVPGRCILAETHLQTHVATPAGSLAEAVAQVAQRWHSEGSPAGKSDVVGKLPDDVTLADLGVDTQIENEPWTFPIGLREKDLQPQQLELYEGEHMMLAGPARSGKSTLLLTIAEGLRNCGTPLQIWGVCQRRSPLIDNPLLDQVKVGQDELAELFAQARLHDGPLVIMIDDADQFEDPDQAITNLLRETMPNLRIIAAGRSDELRSAYSHWSKQIRKSRCGVLLQPNIDFDGDLLGAKLPRRSPVDLLPGRGYACLAGSVALVQTASPTPTSGPASSRSALANGADAVPTNASSPPADGQELDRAARNGNLEPRLS